MKNNSHLLMLGMILPVMLGAGCANPAPVIPVQNPPAQAVQPQPVQQPAGTVNPQPVNTPTSVKTVAPVTNPTPAPKPAPTVAPKKTVTAPAPTASKVYVNISNFSFSPQVIAIKTGDAVVWVNKDSVSHTSKSDGAILWDSGNIAPGGSFSHTFKAPGSYNYSCAIHPTMHGTVIVR